MFATKGKNLCGSLLLTVSWASFDRSSQKSHSKLTLRRSNIVASHLSFGWEKKKCCKNKVIISGSILGSLLRLSSPFPLSLGDHTSVHSTLTNTLGHATLLLCIKFKRMSGECPQKLQAVVPPATTPPFHLQYYENA